MALISTANLTKRYPAVTALDALTIEVEPGIIGLVGANGAGKSTLIKILLGLLPPTSGAATMLGYDVRTQGTVLRQFVGYMPEHDCLPPEVSATEFVSHMGEISGLPRTVARERTADVLRHVGLFEERYRQIGGYSTGMKQRVKLAQALVHDPRLILLDEPTNGLDPQGRDEMLELIQRVGREFGISILMATHLLGEIERVCEDLIVIDGGQLVQQGTLASFTTATATLEVEVDGDPAPLATRLRSHGMTVEAQGSRLFVESEGEPPYDLILDATVESGLGLVRMQIRRHSLSDLFRGTDRAAELAVAERLDA